jgi:maltokinase
MSRTTPPTTNDPLAARPVPDDAVLDLLRAWVPGRRWFPAKGTAGTLSRVAVLTLVDPSDEAEVSIHLLRLPSGGLLQVPVTVRPDRGGSRGDAGPEPGLIGRLADDRLLLDGCDDPAFVRAWLTAAPRADGAELGAREVAAAVDGMRVLTGEQSNTSVLLTHADPPAILKVFRGVGAGPNPDVDVPLALALVGWSGVPRPLAWLTGSWPRDDADTPVVGHLGVLSELVPDAEDGFELACRYAAQGRDFAPLAHDLGRTTAQMHRALRTALPVRATERGPRSPASRSAGMHTVVEVLRRRAAAAVESAPVLAGRAHAIEQVLAAVERVGPLPTVQRVHGDYHLGQVLRSPLRGWSVLDFEGEPQATAAERTRPDLALRDLAGMLRSVDYAAAVGPAASPQWAADARSALVSGYQQEAGQRQTEPATAVLLRALELDKALYEVVYETRNRPAWLGVPLHAVRRLLV